MRRPRCPSDTSNAEWALIEPLLPVPACETPRGGRTGEHPRREVVDEMVNARRHARDYERLGRHSETLITWAAITLMTRRIR